VQLTLDSTDTELQLTPNLQACTSWELYMLARQAPVREEKQLRTPVVGSGKEGAAAGAAVGAGGDPGPGGGLPLG
jgi:hypothetical protein